MAVPRKRCMLVTPFILLLVLLPQRSLGQPSVSLNTLTLLTNRENVQVVSGTFPHLDDFEKMEAVFEDSFPVPETWPPAERKNVPTENADHTRNDEVDHNGDVIMGRDDITAKKPFTVEQGKEPTKHVDDTCIKDCDGDVVMKVDEGYSDHESEDETRLPQPIFDPDPNLRSVRYLPVETTANTSQGTDHSNRPPAVIPDLQVTQWEANEHSLSCHIWDEEDSDDDPRGISKENGTATRTLSEILQLFQDKISPDQICFINVRRSAIWLDTCHQLIRKRFSPNNRISVNFVDNEGKSEGAVDVGGPTREFLRLVVKAANEDSRIFIGPAGCRSLFPNDIAREKDFYRLVGVVLAWSLAHGGPAGNFFSGTLYDSIAYGPGKRPPKLEDIADEVLKQKIIKISDSKTDKELEKNLHDDEIQRILDAQGAAKLPVLKNKDAIVNIILRHVLVDSTRYLLESLKEGLETLGVLEAIKKHPEQFRELFTKENTRPLDFATVDAIFCINYDEQESNERAVQDLTIFHWRIYLQECESGDAGATLGDVLSFATGADAPPVLGDSPVITFQDTRFPTANTCARILRLPTKYETYQEFKKNMNLGILDSPEFGQA